MASDYERIREDNVIEYGRGRRHLELIAGLYSDQTHFIFELIQNAEDAGAHTMEFELLSDRLELRHDGRPFDESDVRGICGIGEGTKSDDLTQIGRFGIGFKSVYAYTSAPEIHSGDEHFCIRDFVRPHAARVVPLRESWTTLFVFPFDKPEVPPDQAVAQIGTGLATLTGRTFLFLRNVAGLAWKVDEGTSGSFRRTSRPWGDGTRVAIHDSDRTGSEREEWLLFSRPIETPKGAELDKGPEIAFKLDTDEDGTTRVEPIVDSPLVVFFPTQKETHLGFLVQGPYQTTPARDNIPHDVAWNRRLVHATGALVVDSLESMRDMGVLSADVLRTLPINADQFPPSAMFFPVYECVRHALQSRELLPTADHGFVSADRAKVATDSELIDLISGGQLTELWRSADGLSWLTSEISAEGTPDLYRYLVGRKSRSDEERVAPLWNGIELVPTDVIERFSAEFLERQSDEWVARLYRYLLNRRYLWDVAKTRPIIRVEAGYHAAVNDDDGSLHAYLPSDTPTELPTVKTAVLELEGSTDFLRAIGLREPDVVAEVEENIIPKYLDGRGPSLSDAELAQDVATIVRAVRAWGPQQRELGRRLRDIAFLRAVNAATGERRFVRPPDAYVATDELRLYFEGNPATWFVDDVYGSGVRRLDELGLTDAVRVVAHRATFDGYVAIKSQWGAHERGVGGFDPRFDIDGLATALEHRSEDRAAFIWNRLLIPNKTRISGVVQRSTRQSFSESVEETVLSTAGQSLHAAAWLPKREGAFVRPAEVALVELPAIFIRDDELARSLGMVPAPVDVLAGELDLAPGDLRFIIDLLRNQPDEVARLKKRIEKGQKNPEESSGEPGFAGELAAALSRPGRREPADDFVSPGPLPDSERRRAHIGEEIAEDMAKPDATRRRFRLAVRHRGEAKDPAVRSFLHEQYNGKCQICDRTFAKRNGQPYFEALFLVPRLSANWYERPGNALCLCAWCASMLQFGPVSTGEEGIIDQVRALGPERRADVTPALRVTICGAEHEIKFTLRHLLDLQQMILADPLESGSETGRPADGD